MKKSKRRTKRKKGAVKRRVAKKGKKKGLRRKPARRKVAKKKTKAAPKGPKLPAEPIGRVTHYFPKVRATAIMIERDGVSVGDVLYFKGHTTAFKQKAESLQIDRTPVSQASPDQEVGIRVKGRTREHDSVFKL